METRDRDPRHAVMTPNASDIRLLQMIRTISQKKMTTGYDTPNATRHSKLRTRKTRLDLCELLSRGCLNRRHSMTGKSLHMFALGAMAAIPEDQRGSVRVLDLPAGEGIIAGPLAAAGFDVTPGELFPEVYDRFTERYAGRPLRDAMAALHRQPIPDALSRGLFGDRSERVTWPDQPRAAAADMAAPLPFDDGRFDVTVCAEGIEHVTDRHQTLAELRRVTRPGGALILTTPNLLSLRARLSYALNGNRGFKSHIDEYTSVWGVSSDGRRTYHGHAFLVSYYQLRYSLHHCGFRIRAVLDSHWSTTSLLLAPMIPLVAYSTHRTQRLARNTFAKLKDRGELDPSVEPPFKDMFRHALSPAMLFGRTLILLAEATNSPHENRRAHRAQREP